MMRRDRTASSILRKVTCTVTAASLVVAFGAPIAQAAPDGGWTAPTEAMSVDDNIVTIGSHGTGNVIGEMLGLNGTVLATNQINPTTLSEATSSDRLGVYGSEANVSPSPYLANRFYNLYAEANGLELTADVVANQVTSAASDRGTNFLAANVAEYGTTGALYYRPDIVSGIDGAVGGVSGIALNRSTTNAKNHATWDGSNSVSQSYQSVLLLRTYTEDSSLIGTRNSDGNVYRESNSYKPGDEGYDPVGVAYYTSDGLSSIVSSVNATASAAELVMQQQDGKTTRYGDPLQIANDYEKYVKASKWYVLSKIADGTVEKKKVAVVSGVSNTSDRFTVLPLNADGEGVGLSARVADAVDGTVDDIARIYNEGVTAGKDRTYVTSAQLAEADIIICNTSIAFDADTVTSRLQANGVTDVPQIVDNSYLNGTFEASALFGNSVESGILSGVMQSLVYPELFDTLDMTGYYFSKFFHLKDSAIADYTKTELAGMTLPADENLESYAFDSSSLNRVQVILNEGTSYYYANKTAVDESKPLLKSDSLLDIANDYGMNDVKISVPEGATYTLANSIGTVISPVDADTYRLNAGATYKLTVSLDGYKDYTATLTGADDSIAVTREMIIANSNESDESEDADPDDNNSGNNASNNDSGSKTPSSNTPIVKKAAKTFTVNTKTVTAKTVAAAAKKAGATTASATSITLGSKVKTIKKGAFKSFKKVKTLTVKTKKLAKKSVKGSLKSSKVKTVKVSVGSKKANKKLVKKYKKIFTKKNAGKKVSVKA